MKIPKIEYEVYYPLNDNNLVKLNLSICKNTNIEISIPVYIDDDIDKYNQSSPYYNDICSKTASKFGTDICIKDRQNEFIDNNMVLCEENCNLIDYDKNTQKAKCSCKIKLSLPLIEDVEIDKNQLYNSFTDINYFANINMVKCFNEVMKKSDLKNNIGFFILLTIIVSYFVILLLFIFKYYQILKYDIFQIFSAKLNMKEEKKTILECKDNDDKILKKKYEKGDILITYTKYTDEKKKNLKKEKNLLTEMKEIKRKEKIDWPKNPKKRKAKNVQIAALPSKENIRFNINNNLLMNSNIIENSKIGFGNKEKQKYEEILKLNDFELNNLPYEKALEEDKRTFIEYYYSLLKINHLFIFTFINNKDYNSKVIKIFLFIFSFALNLTVNACFFNDDTMHKIYIDKGDYNFIYQLPQVIYSSLISVTINIINRKLALSEKDIISLKQKNKATLEQKKNNLLKKLKIKFIIFFLLSFLLLITFWTFITCFCGVYKNTQVHLINDSIIGFVMSLIYPLVIYLIPGIFRINALRSVKKDKNYLYKISKLIQMI